MHAGGAAAAMFTADTSVSAAIVVVLIMVSFSWVVGAGIVFRDEGFLLAPLRSRCQPGATFPL
jgi:hypothetical protein